MLYAILLVVLAIIPALFLGRHILKKDILEKKSMKLIIILVLLGFLAVVIALILEIILTSIGVGANVLENNTSVPLMQILIAAFFNISLSEEGIKWVFSNMIFKKNKHNIRIYDSIVIAAFVALGFAALENIFYVLTGGILYAILRALTAVPIHMCLGVTMGYYLGRAKLAEKEGNMKLKKRYRFNSFFIPFFIHGLYDFLLLSEMIGLILLCMLLIVYVFGSSFQKIKLLSDENENRKVIEDPDRIEMNFCPDCGTKIEGKFCIHCGRKLIQEEENLETI